MIFKLSEKITAAYCCHGRKKTKQIGIMLWRDNLYFQNVKLLFDRGNGVRRTERKMAHWHALTQFLFMLGLRHGKIRVSEGWNLILTGQWARSWNALNDRHTERVSKTLWISWQYSSPAMQQPCRACPGIPDAGTHTYRNIIHHAQ